MSLEEACKRQEETFSGLSLDHEEIVALEEACRTGDLCAMARLGLGKEYARCGGDPRTRAAQGLYWACKYGNLPAVKYFLDIFYPPDRHSDGLKYASQIGNLHVVKYICETWGLSAEHVRCQSNYPLREACWQGHLPMVRYLCETFGLGAEDARACHAEAFACAGGHLPVVQYLCDTLGLGAEDARGFRSLNIRSVCALGRLDVLRYLCETLGIGAEDVRACNNLALRMACYKGHLDVVKYLCETLSLGAEDARSYDNFRYGSHYVWNWESEYFWKMLIYEEYFVSGKSALQAACNFEMVMYLCETLGLDAKDAGDTEQDYFKLLKEWKSRVYWIGVTVCGSPWCPGQEYTKWLVAGRFL